MSSRTHWKAMPSYWCDMKTFGIDEDCMETPRNPQPECLYQNVLDPLQSEFFEHRDILHALDICVSGEIVLCFNALIGSILLYVLVWNLLCTKFIFHRTGGCVFAHTCSMNHEDKELYRESRAIFWWYSCADLLVYLFVVKQCFLLAAFRTMQCAREKLLLRTPWHAHGQKIF